MNLLKYQDSINAIHLAHSDEGTISFTFIRPIMIAIEIICWFNFDVNFGSKHPIETWNYENYNFGLVCALARSVLNLCIVLRNGTCNFILIYNPIISFIRDPSSWMTITKIIFKIWISMLMSADCWLSENQRYFEARKFLILNFSIDQCAFCILHLSIQRMVYGVRNSQFAMAWLYRLQMSNCLKYANLFWKIIIITKRQRSSELSNIVRYIVQK